VTTRPQIIKHRLPIFPRRDFLGRSPDSATAKDVRRFQIEQREAGTPAPAMNSHVAGLRFFFTTTIDRPDQGRRDFGVICIRSDADLRERLAPASKNVLV
jgi:hypothetical protein